MIWVITDSGNDPELFGVDSTGRLKAIVSLSGATNIDWEDLAMGRCGTLTCLYIADTGDNFANRQDVVIYRVPEPNLTPQVTGIAELRVDGVEALRIRYPDGPRDVEAMGVTAAGDVILVSKGRDGAVVAYHVPSAAWDDHSAMARQLDTLPIRPSNAGGRLVTGMAIAPDGRVAVRTYRDIYHFQLTDKLQFDAGKRRVACDILGFEPLGEAIAWRGNDLWLLGERGLFKAGAVFITTCGARVSSSYRNK